ncbi:MAG: outer membrane protein [Planctomycetota bacterium]
MQRPSTVPIMVLVVCAWAANVAHGADEAGAGPSFYVRAGGGFSVVYGGTYRDEAGRLALGSTGTEWDLLSEADFTASLAAGVRLGTSFPLTLELEYRWLNDEFSEVERTSYGGYFFTRASIDAEVESHLFMANALLEFVVPTSYPWRWYVGGGVGWIDTTFEAKRVGALNVSRSIPDSKESNFGGQVMAGIILPVGGRFEFYTDMRMIFGVEYETGGFSSGDVTLTFEVGFRLTF